MKSPLEPTPPATAELYAPEPLHRSDKLRAYAALNHGIGKQAFADEKRTHPKLARPASAARTAGESALDAMQVSVIGASADGLITYANAQAKTELQALGLTQQGASRLAEGSPCRLLITQVLADNTPHGVRLLDAASLSRIVTAFPAPGFKTLHSQLERKHTAVVLVFSKPGRRGPRPSLLMEWFGLSAAEARLANVLAAGSSIEQYATIYSISVATARTQLRAILKKTGAGRQQELVRLLASLPAI